MKPRDEEFAKESFDSFLRQQVPLERTRWQEGDEPPDYFLQLDGERYGVEVTMIVPNVELDGVSYSSRMLGDALRRFSDDLQERARAAGILRGAYVVWLEPIEDFKRLAPVARKSFLRYVERTRDVESAPQEVVARQRGVRWYIKKLHAEKDYLTWTMATGGGGFEGAVRQELVDLLAGCVESKTQSLSEVEGRIILLMVDAYHCAESHLWLDCLPDGLRRFHTVARVFQDHECQILKSEREDWRA